MNLQVSRHHLLAAFGALTISRSAAGQPAPSRARGPVVYLDLDTQTSTTQTMLSRRRLTCTPRGRNDPSANGMRHAGRPANSLHRSNAPALC